MHNDSVTPNRKKNRGVIWMMKTTKGSESSSGKKKEATEKLVAPISGKEKIP